MIGNHRDKRDGKREVGAHTRPIGNLGMDNENGPYQGHCGTAVGKWKSKHFYTRSQNCEKRLLASPCLSLHIHAEQLGSHGTDFNEIWYLSIFRKSAKAIKVSLKSEKNNGYFTLRPIYTYDYTSLSS